MPQGSRTMRGGPVRPIATVNGCRWLRFWAGTSRPAPVTSRILRSVPTATTPASSIAVRKVVSTGTGRTFGPTLPSRELERLHPGPRRRPKPRGGFFVHRVPSMPGSHRSSKLCASLAPTGWAVDRSVPRGWSPGQWLFPGRAFQLPLPWSGAHHPPTVPGDRSGVRVGDRCEVAHASRLVLNRESKRRPMME